MNPEQRLKELKFMAAHLQARPRTNVELYNAAVSLRFEDAADYIYLRMMGISLQKES